MATQIGGLLLNEKYSDVALVVEGESLPAHKIILASSCEYFRALLFGNMEESLKGEIVLKDVPLRGFKQVLGYIYAGGLNFDGLDEDTILDTLEVAHLYGLENLQTAIREYFRKNLSEEILFKVYDKAQQLQLKDFTETVCRFADYCPLLFLESEEFCRLPAASVRHILSRDTFFTNEINIFKAVARWCAERPQDEDKSEVLGVIRLPLIATKDLVSTVKDSGLIADEILLEAIRTRECRTLDLKCRGVLVHEDNLATSKYDAWKLTEVKDGNYVAARDGPIYIKSFIAPDYYASRKKSLTIALKSPHIINHVEFRLTTQCSYFIETSTNLEDWFRILDYSNYRCHGLQKVHLEPRVVRYIRVTTSEDSAECLNQYLDFKATYTSKPLRVVDGFYAPEENVASEKLGAVVTKGVNKIGGCISGFRSDDGQNRRWTWHAVNTSGITIRLPQPCVVGSMRLLLRNGKSRGHKFYIETSLDAKSWTLVADRTSEHHRSWQAISFEPLPVLYIKLVGAATTDGEA